MTPCPSRDGSGRRPRRPIVGCCGDRRWTAAADHRIDPFRDRHLRRAPSRLRASPGRRDPPTVF